MTRPVVRREYALAPDGPGEPSARTKTRVVPRVLVVDDDATNRLLARFMLEKLECDIEAVESGALALACIAERDFDVILMDGSMPEMDGCETTRAVRALESERERRTWIIAVTAHAMRGDRERFLDAGMDDYLVKPYALADLHAALLRARGTATYAEAGRISSES